MGVKRCRPASLHYWIFISLYIVLIIAIKGGLRAKSIASSIKNDRQQLDWIEGDSFHHRNLLNNRREGENCTPLSIYEFPPDPFTQEERQQGAVIVHVILCSYLLFALALICDDYFVPSLERLCDDMHLSSDVAGATFMAAATSAPELFTNVVGTFITEGDIGIGTIVGSAVFNILAVSACCGLSASEAIRLDWWPLTRDCFAYGVSVVLLILFLADEHIYWWESLILVLTYSFYIVIMYYNENLKAWATGLVDSSCCNKRKSHSMSIEEPDEKTPLNNHHQHNDHKTNGSCVENGGSNGHIPHTHNRSMSADSELIKKALETEEDNEMPGPFSLPRGLGFCGCIFWVVRWPASLIFAITVPDCRKDNLKFLYPLSFFMCVLWIGCLSYLVAWMITVIGYTFNVPDSVMGLTFLAAGTSLPEAVSSVIVTRQGLGGMGISNSIGSNTFDILLCLGLPWLVRSAFFPVNGPDEHFVYIYSRGIEFSALILLSSLIVLYLILVFCGFKLGKKVGIIALLMYAVFLVFAALFELNVFFEVNLPSCGPS